MIYAYDKWLPMPVADLYDTQMMGMAINAAKDMYEKGLQQIKDFKKEYDDFSSPFVKDVLRHGEIINGINDVINDLYERGVDPIRSAEGRAAVAQAIRSVNPAEINNMRANAKVGYAYLDALSKLNAAGKYDKAMNDYFLLSHGLPRFEDFSSANSATWSMSSPVEASSLKDITSPYFDKRTAYDLSPEEVRAFNMQYDPNARYSGYSEAALLRDAGIAVPGIQGDWRGDYFRKLAEYKLKAQDPMREPTQAEIDAQLQRDIAEANREYLIRPTADYSDYWKKQANALGWANHNLSKDRLKKEQRNTQDKDLDGVSLFERWYAKGAANVMSSIGSRHNWYDMRNSYGYFGNNAYKAFYDYGQRYTNNHVKEQDLLNDSIREDFSNYLKKTGKEEGQINSLLRVFTDNNFKSTKSYKKAAEQLLRDYNVAKSKRSEKDAIAGFENQFSIPMDERAVVKSIGDSYKGNNKVAKLSLADINRLYDVDDIITGTAGYTKRHKDVGTSKLRSVLNNSTNLDITFTPLGTGYGSLRKNSGSFEVNPKGRIEVIDSEGNILYSKDAYYDLGLGSDTNAGGAYIGNNPILNDGVAIFGSYTNPSDPIRLPVQPTSVGNSYNLYPSYDRWLEYGSRDVRATKDAMQATQPAKQSTL